MNIMNKLIMGIVMIQGVINLYCVSESAIHLVVNQLMDGRVKFFNMIELVKFDGILNRVNALTRVITLRVSDNNVLLC